MALTKGNTTSDRRIPSASSYSFSHNQNTGSDGHLFVVIACPATTVSSVTYGGNSMTLVQRRSTSYSTDWTVWELDAPPTGSNTVAVTMASANYNGVSTFVVSFTGCSGVGNTAYNGTPSTTTTASITISNNSIIIGASIGGNNTGANMEIPQGTARTLEWNDNINNFTWGAVSPTLSSGSVTCESNSSASNILMLTEVQEAGGGGGGNSGSFFLMFN